MTYLTLSVSSFVLEPCSHLKLRFQPELVQATSLLFGVCFAIWSVVAGINHFVPTMRTRVVVLGHKCQIKLKSIAFPTVRTARRFGSLLRLLTSFTIAFLRFHQ